MSNIRLEFIGHLAETPELRRTAGGTSVTSFRIIANGRRYDSETGTWVDTESTALRVTAWDELAEHAAASLTVGSLVSVTGSRLSAGAYVHAESGEPRATLELVADRVGVDLATQTSVVTKAPRRRKAEG